MASRRTTTRKTGLDIGDKRATTSKSETSVTVKPHPGPSFGCEPSQTHSLEGGPDDLLSRPQRVEARHLGAEICADAAVARQRRRSELRHFERVPVDLDPCADGRGLAFLLDELVAGGLPDEEEMLLQAVHRAKD